MTTTPELLKSLLNFHKECPLIKKDAKNNFKNYDYARLEDILITINPLLTKNDLFITHLLQDDNKLITRLYHSEGGYIDSIATMPFDRAKSKNAEQEWGSSLTYAKRYNLCNVLNLIVADDEFCTTHGKPEQKIPDNVTELPKPTPKPAPMKSSLPALEFDTAEFKKAHGWIMRSSGIKDGYNRMKELKEKFRVSREVENFIIEDLKARIDQENNMYSAEDCNVYGSDNSGWGSE